MSLLQKNRIRILKLANVRKLRAAYFKLWIGVKTLGHGIGDGVSRIGQQVAKLDFERSGDVFNWSQPTTDRPAVPAIKKAIGLCGIKTAPELSKKFLDLPGSGDLGSTGAQSLKLQPVSLVPVLGIL